METARFIAHQAAKTAYVQNLKVSDVVSVYTGKAGSCCCGCSGIHRYSTKHAKVGAKRRGYELETKEINDRHVAKVLRWVQATSIANPALVKIGQNHLAVDIGEKVYLVYPLVDPPKDMVNY
jgi:hypothetical protein